MTHPYEIPAGASWSVARRCLGGRRYLAPDRSKLDEVIKNAILYVIARKADITATAIHAFTYQPNHEHIFASDLVEDELAPDPNFPLFCTTLHADIAKIVKSHRGMLRGVFWEPDDHVPLQVMTVDDCWRTLVYMLTNPVKDGLVSRHGSYPGAISTIDMIRQRRVLTRRPTFYRATQTSDMKLRGQDVLPETIILEFSMPPILEAAGYTWDAYVSELADRVDQRERQILATRRSYGLSAIGARRCRHLDWRTAPVPNELPKALLDAIRTEEAKDDDARDPHRLAALYAEAELLPSDHHTQTHRVGRYTAARVTTTSRDLRKSVIEHHIKFAQRHGAGLRRYRQGDAKATFPEGTYIMRKYHRATIRGRP